MAASVRVKAIAVPPEHGAWGFLFEPIVLGLLVAPSLAGVSLAFGVVGAFLVRHPLKVALVDWRRRKRYARTRVAERVALVYNVLAVVGLLGAVALAGPDVLLPLLLAVPLGGLILWSSAQNRGRELLPELAGAVALALAAASIALAGGEPWETALALWVILTARDVPSILYVRTRLRLERGQPHLRWVPIAAHAIGLLAVGFLAALGAAPWLAVVALGILLGRAMLGLSPARRQIRTQTVGFLEIGYGLLTVFLTALGYALPL